MPDPVWQVWIDTGGTFTDCLALDPHGVMHRAKVLSSGVLRGRVIRWIDDRRVIIDQRWNACDDFITDFGLGAVNVVEAQKPPRVKAFDAGRSVIELHGPCEVKLGEGSVFELRSSEPAPILAARLVTRTPVGRPLPPIALRLATTRGTNSLLERMGAPTALFVTRGFADLLLIGDQQRPELFALNIIKPAPLHECAVEVSERLAADGSVIVPLDLWQVERSAGEVFNKGIRSAAVALVHSYINPHHEQQVAAILKRVGFEHITCSSDASPTIKFLTRAQTAVVDAYLSPVIHTYFGEVQQALEAASKQSTLHAMTSAGGLVRAAQFRASESLLSGPAGGVSGAAESARRSGFTRIIGFDMGGTSTDVARFDGDFEYRFEHAVAGVRLMKPALNIHTVAAGGGSICGFVDGRFTVGPQSAGSAPGPACYGAGGPLTITDVNLLLGRLAEDQFEIPLTRDAAEGALQVLLDRVQTDRAVRPDREEVLAGLTEIANQRMSDAITQISVRQGYDPADYALVAFGGAGGQHACALADALGIATILLPRDASLLSALGLGSATIERIAQRQVLENIDDCDCRLQAMLDELDEQSRSAVVEEGVPASQVQVRRRIVNMRLLGQDHAIGVELKDEVARSSTIRELLRSEFVDRYRALYGHAPVETKPIEIESLRVIASATRDFAPCEPCDAPGFTAASTRTMRTWLDGRWLELTRYELEELSPGAEISAPSIVVDRRTSLLLDCGWQARVDAAGAIVATKASNSRAGLTRSRRNLAAAQEVFSSRLTSIAIEMGEMLQRTALSVNVKERLDFSCAVMDSDGQLVVNAPHIPVHLGAMGMCVRSVREFLDMQPGDVIVTNHPRFGGTHLPDITVITPVFAGRGELIGYVASRAHHAEIGGTRPGSMPPNATNLAEEGVVISPQHLVRGGESCFDDLGRLLRDSKYPSRAVADNLADLRAAVAANERGRQGLMGIASEFGVSELRTRMRSGTDHAFGLARDALRSIMNRAVTATEFLDDGSTIRVSIESDEPGPVVFDFLGTASQHVGNLNATPAIVHSAVMYVLRLLIGRDVPLNEGIMRAVLLNIPEGSMFNPIFNDDPGRCPAVVGGNTETSQRLVDTLIKALGLSACGQGTMNNVVFGNNRFGYYETICGGAGAGPGFNGADAVHTHMTNTRITDSEIIEHRYPVRVGRFEIRRGSGGKGQWRGGDGAIREMTFLRPVSLSVLSQHRVQRPYGNEGGEPGMPGRQCVHRSTGERIELGSIDACELNTGDRLLIETPGGGGWGAPPGFSSV